MTAATSCPKCGRDPLPAETSCARCGLLRSRFSRFTEAQKSDPDEALVEPLWSACRAAWDSPAAHDRLIAQATHLACLPVVARRYRNALHSGTGTDAAPDPIAEKRLQQIAVLIETAARSQVRASASPRAARAVWIAGYAMTAIVLALSVWLFLSVLRRHG